MTNPKRWPDLTITFPKPEWNENLMRAFTDPLTITGQVVDL